MDPALYARQMFVEAARRKCGIYLLKPFASMSPEERHITPATRWISKWSVETLECIDISIIEDIYRGTDSADKRVEIMCRQLASYMRDGYNLMKHSADINIIRKLLLNPHLTKEQAMELYKKREAYSSGKGKDVRIYAHWTHVPFLPGAEYCSKHTRNPIYGHLLHTSRRFPPELLHLCKNINMHIKIPHNTSLTYDEILAAPQGLLYFHEYIAHQKLTYEQIMDIPHGSGHQYAAAYCTDALTVALNPHEYNYILVNQHCAFADIVAVLRERGALYEACIRIYRAPRWYAKFKMSPERRRDIINLIAEVSGNTSDPDWHLSFNNKDISPYIREYDRLMYAPRVFALIVMYCDDYIAMDNYIALA